MPDLTDMTRADLERMRTALDLILRCSEKAAAAGLDVRFHRSGDEFGLILGSGEIAARDAAGPAEAQHIDDAGEPMPAVAVTTVREDASPEAPASAPRPSMPPATSDLSAFTVVSEDRPEASRRDPQAAHAVASNLRAPGWTPEEDARALEMANRGVFAAEIAETLGRPLRGVQQRLRKLRTGGAAKPAPTNSIPVNSQPVQPAKRGGFRGAKWSSEEEATAFEMDARGGKAPEIAEALGRPVRGVKQKLPALKERCATAKGPTVRPDPDNRAKAARAAIPAPASFDDAIEAMRRDAEACNSRMRQRIGAAP